jgi:transposase
MHYITGQDRQQSQFFSKLDDLVSSRHYVRLIDLIADRFVSDHAGLFALKGTQNIGRKAYHPSTLLKLYIYGYLNGIASSRKLEKECHRNIELMWLMGQLTPDHKTVSDFRKENSEAIHQSVHSFNQWLQQAGYIKGETVSIDGSRIRANASKSFDLESILHKLEQTESQLSEYIELLSVADQADSEREQLQEERKRLQQQVEDLQRQVTELETKRDMLTHSNAKRLSPTDPQARIMKSRQGKHFCYNIQSVVDEQHKLIVCNKVESRENDKGLLAPMVEQTANTLSKLPKEVLADAGYYQLDQIESLEKKSVDCYVAINENQEQKKEEQGIGFTYHEEKNIYTCSQGQSLIPQHGVKRDLRRGTQAQGYRGTNCQPCAVKQICTQAQARTVYRFSNQAWRDVYKAKMNSEAGKSKLKLRMTLSEHPFGTLKYWMGHIPILLRGRKKVQTEINIYQLVYNFKRMLSIATFESLEKVINQKRFNNCLG